MGLTAGERQPTNLMASAARIGLLVIEAEVGRGAASVVHAVRASTGERLALKAYDPEIRALHPGASGFEATVDPRVVRYRSTLETGDLPRERLYRATDLVRAVPATLAQLGSLRRAVAFWAGVARALGVVHARGLAHGNVRPNHAALLPEDRPLVLDPGVVPTPTGANRSPEAAFFLAPEAIQDLLDERLPRATPRADVYGLAASLVVALGGQPPGASFAPSARASMRLQPLRAAGATITGALDTLLESKRTARPPVVSALTVPVRALDLRALNEALARALDADPEARFEDGNALALALEGAARVETSGRFPRAVVSSGNPRSHEDVPMNQPSDTRRVSARELEDYVRRADEPGTGESP